MIVSAPKSLRRTLKLILWTAGGIALLVGALFVVAFADVLGFFHEPPLRLAQSGSTLTAHVETLGEYQTTVGRMRIQEAGSGKVVFEAVARKRAAQIFNFKLIEGINQTNLMGDESDSYSIIEPRKETTFTLHRGVRYR